MRSALFLSLFCVCLLAATGRCQTVPLPGASPPEPAGSKPQTQAEQPKPATNQPAAQEKRNFYVEIGGSFSRFSPGGSTWRSADTRLIYKGFKKFTPFGGVATQSNSAGSQQSFGMGSYITVNKWSYAVVQFSMAPNARTIFFPRAGFGATWLFNVRKVKGLVMATGYGELLPYRKTGGGGRVFSIGPVYYTKVGIFTGGISFNQALPSGRRSASGQFGLMRGAEGKYWLTAGISGGRVAYQLTANVPFDVRYNTMGCSIAFQKWIGRHWGIAGNYGYQNAFSNFERHSLHSSVFFEL